MSVEMAYEILKESFFIDKENSSARALNYYFTAGAKLTSKKVLSKEELINLFYDVSDIIEYKEATLKQINFELTQKEVEDLSSKESKTLLIVYISIKTLIIIQ